MKNFDSKANPLRKKHEAKEVEDVSTTTKMMKSFDSKANPLRKKHAAKEVEDVSMATKVMKNFGSKANPLMKKHGAKEVEDVSTTTKMMKNFGSKANPLRKKHGVREGEDVSMATKKRKEEEHALEKTEEGEKSDGLKRRRPNETSEECYLDHKFPLSTNLVEKQRESNQDFKGFVMPPPLSPKKALRAATLKIRFADTIIKAKYRKAIEESSSSSNKADVMMRMQKEKKLLERKEQEEKARIEAELKAPGLKLRHETQLAIKKREEEAKSNFEEDPLVVEKEMVNLCGGYYQARTRFVEKFGLFLKSDGCGLEEIERKACDHLT